MHRVPSSKTAVPAVPAGTVARPELFADLDRGAECALTLVSAPPGYGKTLLLADWVQRRPEVRTGWVSLDEDDRAPDRFWAAVVSALFAVDGGTGGGGTDEIRHLAARWAGRALRPGDEVELVAHLLGTVGTGAHPLRLVVDGADHLGCPRVLDALTALVRTPRRGLRIVLASRAVPALPVARLRMEGRLSELAVDDLRFTLADTGRFVHEAGLRLTGAQVELLRERTGGWAAGLRLAAMRLREHADADRVLGEFSGAEWSVADYLVAEVLAHLDDDERELLRRVSVADAAAGVPAALAVELSGRDDAAAALDRIGQRTGFLVAAGERGAYRTEELLRSHLSADLHRHGPELARGLHRRAAGWWVARDRPVEGLGHALASGDTGLLGDLAGRCAAVLTARGEHAVLGRLAGAVGPAADPWLLPVLAAVRLGQGRHAELRSALRGARRTGRAPAGSDLARYRDAVEGLCGVPSAGRAAVGTVPPDDPALAALWLAGRGAGAVVAGRPAVADLELALALCRDHDLTFLEGQTLCLLAAAEWAAGRFGSAVGRAAAGVAAVAPEAQGSPWAVTARVIVAYAGLLAGRPRATLAGVALGPDVAADVSPVRSALRALRGAALFDSGTRDGGLDELHRARVLLGPHAPVPAVAAAVALLEQQCALQLGYGAEAAGAVGWLAAAADAPAELALARARTELWAGRKDRARAVVAPLLDGTGGDGLLPGTTVEAWLVEADAAFAAGERAAGSRALRTALATAETGDVVRPFASAGRGVAEHVVDLVGATVDRSGFAVRVLATLRRARRPRPGPVALSPREHDVLTKLPSLDSLDEIAAELGVSVNTVKTHLRSIYVKLGVTGRRAAVLAAHDRGALV